jgi:EAL domain-containing protein (putative c-di-GMP-specific phosphodiesterase class I)
VFVSASIGIALSTPEEGQPERLMREADLAMYRAKTTGKAQYAVFDDSLGAGVLRRLEMENDLRRALERGEFRLHYQPVVCLDSGRIGEVEALVRWEHPVLGLIPPEEFIALAEETGLILPLGRWVLEEACRQAKAWQTDHAQEPPLMVSVNLSPKQVQHATLVDEIAAVLRQTGLDPRCLKVEITENVLMHDAASAEANLQGLRALGVQVAIDDFGTGYSSLAYLKRFHVDAVKIGRTFIERLGRDPEDTAIVQAIITLAKALNLVVAGEGVETAEQLARLRLLGCDQAQGYYFARPGTGMEIGVLLADAAVPGARRERGAPGNMIAGRRGHVGTAAFTQSTPAAGDGELWGPAGRGGVSKGARVGLPALSRPAPPAGCRSPATRLPDSGPGDTPKPPPPRPSARATPPGLRGGRVKPPGPGSRQGARGCSETS